MSDVLFAVKADEKISEGLFNEALRICDEGIENFPHYPIAYFIKSLALLKKGDKENSLYALEEGLIALPFNSFLLSAKESLLKNSSFMISDNTDEQKHFINFDEKGFIKKLIALGINDESAIKSDDVTIIPGAMKYKFSQQKPEEKKEIKTVKNVESVQNDVPRTNVNLGKIAEELNKYSKSQKSGASERQAPVSDTLAKIYEAQGAYSEAIKAYETLMAQKPEQKDFYFSKINSLKAKL